MAEEGLTKCHLEEDTPSDSDFAFEPNPFLLDVVLDKVFEHLCLHDLLQCRLVCRLWCKNSNLKQMIKDQSAVSLRSVYLHSATTVENIDKYFHIGGPIYSRYYFEDISYQNVLISKFFQVMGPTMEILKLHLSLNQLKIDQFRELLYERAVNLRELNIFSLSHEEVFLKQLFPDLAQDKRPKHFNLKRLELQEIRSPIVGFMTQFMGTLPNLREIILKSDVCSDWSEQSEIWRQNSSIATSVIRGMRNSDMFRTVKEFRCGKLRIDHINALRDMGERGLQLEIFETHIPLKDAGEAFTAFLNTQKDSLKQLIIFEQRATHFSRQRGIAAAENNMFVLTLPDKMCQLETLQFSKSHKSMMVPIHPVDYARQCPKLKRLILLGHNENCCLVDYLGAPFQTPVPVSTVVLNDEVSNGEIASYLGKAFPYLTKLHVRHPSQEFLEHLWNTCVTIKHLSLDLDESEYMDGAISGCCPNFINRWLDNRLGSSMDSTELEEVVEQKTEQSILNLKDLQTLKIIVEHNEREDRQALSDAVAFFALRSMTYLRNLELLSCHWFTGLSSCFFISEDCQNLLKKELCHTVVLFSPYSHTELENESKNEVAGKSYAEP